MGRGIKEIVAGTLIGALLATGAGCDAKVEKGNGNVANPDETTKVVDTTDVATPSDTQEIVENATSRVAAQKLQEALNKFFEGDCKTFVMREQWKTQEKTIWINGADWCSLANNGSWTIAEGDREVGARYSAGVFTLNVDDTKSDPTSELRTVGEYQSVVENEDGSFTVVLKDGTKVEFSFDESSLIYEDEDGTKVIVVKTSEKMTNAGFKQVQEAARKSSYRSPDVVLGENDKKAIETLQQAFEKTNNSCRVVTERNHGELIGYSYTDGKEAYFKNSENEWSEDEVEPESINANDVVAATMDYKGRVFVLFKGELYSFLIKDGRIAVRKEEALCPGEDYVAYYSYLNKNEFAKAKEEARESIEATDTADAGNTPN